MGSINSSAGIGPTSIAAPASRLDWPLTLLVLFPLVGGVALSLSAPGREAMAFWWRDARGWQVLARSLAFAATGATVALAAGGAIAVALPRSGTTWSRVVLVASCVPLLVPSSLVGVGWIMAMGRDAVVTNLLRPLFGDATPTIYQWPLAAAATGLRYLGVAGLVIAAARRAGGDTWAAETAFALRFRQRLRLRVGELTVPLLAAWLLLVLLVGSDHILPGMFLVHTFGAEVLIQFNALMDPSGAAALALPPALLALAVMPLCAGLLRGGGDRLSGPSVTRRLRAPQRVASAALVGAILAIAAGIPVAGLVARAGGVAHLADAWRQSRAEAGHSLWLAVLGGVATLVAAMPLAGAWVRAGRARGASPAPLVLLNLAVPASLLALGVLTLLARARLLHDGNVPLVYAYAARFTPIAVVVLCAGWSRIAPTGDFAARVHAVPPVQRLVRISAPSRAEAAVAALVLVMLLVTAELEMSLILVPPGPTTLGVRLYTLIHTAPDHVVAALAVDVLLLAVAAVLAGAALSHIVMRVMRRGAT